MSNEQKPVPPTQPGWLTLQSRLTVLETVNDRARVTFFVAHASKESSALTVDMPLTEAAKWARYIGRLVTISVYPTETQS